MRMSKFRVALFIMTENQNCVFISPNFETSEIISIVYSTASLPDTAPVLKVSFSSVVIELQGRIKNDRIIWDVENSFLYASSSSEMSIIGKANEEIKFDLNDLLFYNPSELCQVPHDVYMPRFQSGLYIRRDDLKEDSVSFSISSILTLDYENIEKLQIKLDELQNASNELNETKKKLKEEGIDLEKLASLKMQIQEALKEKRIAQYKLTQENQKISAVTVHSKNEAEYNNSLEILRNHLEANRNATKVNDTSTEKFKNLLKFKLAALDELKMIFPFSLENNTICENVHFYGNPLQQQQWDETRAFMGFATHYIREVAHVIGIPLPYNLFPLTTSSKIICRLTNETRQIPQTEDIRQLSNYANGLMECARHILNVLDVIYEEPLTFIKALNCLYLLTEENIKTLIPNK